MKSKTIAVSAVLLLSVALLLVVPVAYAKPPVKATGSFVSTVTSASVQVAGESCVFILTQTLTSTFTEDEPNTGIVGTASADFRATINACGDVARLTFKTIWTFESVRIAGREGGVILEQNGRGEIDPSSSPLVTFEGQLVFRGGTGDLANLHGQGEVQGSAPPITASYEINIHFDP